MTRHLSRWLSSRSTASIGLERASPRRRRPAAPAPERDQEQALRAGRRGRCGSRRHGACWPGPGPGRPRARLAPSPAGRRAAGPNSGPCGAEQVRRRADRDAGRRSARDGTRSRSRPGRRRPRGRGRARPACRRRAPRAAAVGELPVGEVLQPGVVGDRAPHAPPRRPAPPRCRRGGTPPASRRATGRPAARKCSDRASNVAWASRSSPPSRRKRSKPASVPARAGGLRPEGAQHRVEHSCPDAWMVDERAPRAAPRSRRARSSSSASARDPAKPRQAARVDEQRLEEQARGRRVGRDLGPVGAEQGVDRAEAEERRPAQARLPARPRPASA